MKIEKNIDIEYDLEKGREMIEVVKLICSRGLIDIREHKEIYGYDKISSETKFSIDECVDMYNISHNNFINGRFEEALSMLDSIEDYCIDIDNEYCFYLMNSLSFYKISEMYRVYAKELDDDRVEVMKSCYCTQEDFGMDKELALAEYEEKRRKYENLFLEEIEEYMSRGGLTAIEKELVN